MKKTNKKILLAVTSICCCLTMALAFAGFTKVDKQAFADATTTTYTSSEIVTGVVANSLGAFETTEAKFEMFHGTLDNPVAFTANEGTGDGGWQDDVYDGGTGAGSSSCCWQRWQARSSINNYAILKLTSKVDDILTIGNSAGSNDVWASGNVVLYYQPAGGERSQVSSVSIGDMAAIEGGHKIQDGELFPTQLSSIKTGDVVYVVYEVTADQQTADILPTFTFGVTYSYENGSSIVTGQVASGLDKSYETKYASFKVLHGTIADMQAFTTNEGTGDGQYTDAVYDGGSSVGDSLCCLQRWQARSSTNNFMIIKATLKYDLAPVISNQASTVTPWAGGKMVLYHQSGSSEPTIISSVTLNNEQALAAGYYFPTQIENAKAGDNIYIVYEVEADKQTTDFIPEFTWGTKPDEPVVVTVDSYDLSYADTKMVAGEGAEYTNSEISKFQVGYGSIDNFNAFEHFAGSGEGGSDDACLSEGLAYDSNKAAVRRWGMRCSTDNSVIFKLTALKDSKVTIGNTEVGEPWATDTKVSIYQYVDGTLVTIKSTPVTTAKIEADALGADVQAKAGDIIYVVYETVEGEDKSGGLDTVLTFKFDTEAYDYFGRPLTTKSLTVEYPDLISNFATRETCTLDYQYATISIMYGDVPTHDFHNFTAFYLGGNDGDCVKDSGDYNNGYQRWQQRASAALGSTIMKIQVAQDTKLDLSHVAPPASPWATHSYFAVVVENENGTQLTLCKNYVKANAPANYFLPETVMMKSGDILYIIYDMNDESTGTCTTDLLPVFVFNTEGYDESKRADFATFESLVTVKANANTELDTYLATFSEDDYTIARYASITDIVTTAKATIKDLMSESEITATVTQAKADMDAVLTKAEEQAELDTYKAGKVAELEAYAKEEDYSADNWKLVQDAISSAKEKINAATSKAGANTALAAGKGAIDKIEKKSSKSSGCGSTLPISGLAILGLACVAIVAKKRK